MTPQNNMRGYTIIELMIALVVSAIVIAGSLAGFNIIEKQFNEVNLETALDRQAANFIRELQKDISMAGYKEFQGDISMSGSEAIQFESTPYDDGNNPGQIVQEEFRVTYDAKDDTDVTYRKNVRYQCKKLSGASASDLFQCQKTVAKCIASPCIGAFSFGSNVIDVATDLKEETEITRVKEFSITRDNFKDLPETVYDGFPQVLRIKLVLFGEDKSKGVDGIEKIYHFSIRARNISMIRSYED
ncbi:prepilin-type N-terminal cleavage/methylation domain-containing protein [Methylophilaceae bacterium Uisw_099_01]|jgi:prepilin-type N-terminal cleavage/methylation domain-containing protein|nr:prepilin-type N-terminal cleavage/methylation domain-containing protein [Methylophilaceae bacterium]|tara:strand:- start:905 stop:1636 length:732 start_codon:yes stop_codon:yes gene_type:complete